MAFGRLRIDSPHTVRSPHHHRTQRAAEGNDEVGFSSSKPYHASWVDLRSLETKPLLAKTVAGPGAGAMPTERLLLTHVSTASMESIVPPMVVWIGPALLCALAYALYNIFIKKGSASIHPVLGGVILQLVAAILGSLLLGFIIVQQHQMEADNDNVGLYYDSEGVKYAVYAGIAVGTAEMLSFFVSSLGVQGTKILRAVLSSLLPLR